MKKQLLLLALLLSTTVYVFAEEVKIDNLWYEVVSKTKEATVIKYKDNIKYSGRITIPESIQYKGETYSVTSIGIEAFQYCSSLNSITIPNSVTIIKGRAFSSCI